MKIRFLPIFVMVCISGILPNFGQEADDHQAISEPKQPDTTKLAPDPHEPPNMDEIREELKDLTGEERAAKLEEYRKRYGKSQSTGTGFSQQISAEKWRSMSKEQKREFLLKMQAERSSKPITPEQRAAQLKQAQVRLDEQIKSLKLKRAVGSITQRESEILSKLEDQQRRLRTRIKPPEYREGNADSTSTHSGN